MSEPIECVEHQREEEDSLQSNQWTCGFVKLVHKILSLFVI